MFQALNATECLIVVLAKPTRKVKAKRDKRVVKRLCLGVDFDGKNEIPCNCESKKRGNCPRHFNRIYYKMSRMTPERAKAYEAKLIRMGRLLASYEKVELDYYSKDGGIAKR